MIRRIRTMGFQELAVFSEVANHSSITTAAETMGLAKSAVSVQLKKLEERLGVELFTRSSRRLLLTSEGKRLLPRVESLLAEGETLIALAEKEHTAPSGLVRIAMTPDFGAKVVNAFIPKVTAAYPEIQIATKLNYHYENLQDPAFDLAFRIGQVNDEGLVAKKLGEFQRIVVASPDYLSQTPISHPNDLGAANCLIFSSSTTERVWNFYRKRQKELASSVNVQGNIAVQSFSALAHLAEQGCGVAYLPDFVAKPLVQTGRLRCPLPDWHSTPTDVLLAYRFGVDRIHRVKAVLQLAKTVIPKLLS